VITFYASESNAPGASVGSRTVTATKEVTGQMFYGVFPLYRYEALFPESVDIGAGWISIEATGDNSGCQFAWMSSPEGNGYSYEWDGSAPVLTGADLAFCLGGPAVARTLTVVTPNGAEEWPAGTTQTITWNSTGIIGPDVRLALHNGMTFVDWIVRKTENDGAYNWIVWSDLAPLGSYTVRVQAYDDAEVRDYSDAGFSVTPIGVVAPNGGEEWVMGSVYTIRWGSNASLVGADVRVGLHDGTTFLYWIDRFTPNDGVYSWLVPTNLAPGYGYRIRLQSYTDALVKDFCDTPFTIEAAPLLLTAPVKDELVLAGSAYSITWQSNDPGVGDDVRLGLHRGGAFLGWLVRRTTNDGQWDWPVPPETPPAINYRLRLQSFTDSSLRNMSPPFAIANP